ncbi:hypothetical protein [Microcoleus sp. Pol7_A1]|uniref:hypothetical protein n=1 Tax=Microcoleus sp. Pol7_A1 TaxID=2818893 RepID=UPI002FD36E84
MKTQTRSPTSFLPLGFSLTEFDSEVGDLPEILPLFSNAVYSAIALLSISVDRGTGLSPVLLNRVKKSDRTSKQIILHPPTLQEHAQKSQ